MIKQLDSTELEAINAGSTLGKVLLWGGEAAFTAGAIALTGPIPGAFIGGAFKAYVESTPVS